MAKQPLYPHVTKVSMTSNIYEGDKPPSAYAAEIAEKKKSAITLLSQALQRAEEEDFPSALWRASYAAGELSFFLERTAIGMPPNPTGRGFFVDMTKGTLGSTTIKKIK